MNPPQCVVCQSTESVWQLCSCAHNVYCLDCVIRATALNPPSFMTCSHRIDLGKIPVSNVMSYAPFLCRLSVWFRIRLRSDIPTEHIFGAFGHATHSWLIFFYLALAIGSLFIETWTPFLLVAAAQSLLESVLWLHITPYNWTHFLTTLIVFWPIYIFWLATETLTPLRIAGFVGTRVVGYLVDLSSVLAMQNQILASLQLGGGGGEGEELEGVQVINNNNGDKCFVCKQAKPDLWKVCNCPNQIYCLDCCADSPTLPRNPCGQIVREMPVSPWYLYVPYLSRISYWFQIRFHEEPNNLFQAWSSTKHAVAIFFYFDLVALCLFIDQWYWFGTWVILQAAFESNLWLHITPYNRIHTLVTLSIVWPFIIYWFVTTTENWIPSLVCFLVSRIFSCIFDMVSNLTLHKRILLKITN